MFVPRLDDDMILDTIRKKRNRRGRFVRYYTTHLVQKLAHQLPQSWCIESGTKSSTYVIDTPWLYSTAVCPLYRAASHRSDWHAHIHVNSKFIRRFKTLYWRCKGHELLTPDHRETCMIAGDGWLIGGGPKRHAVHFSGQTFFAPQETTLLDRPL
jgi:hypothetical protein